MSKKMQYQTKQRDELLSYLKSVRGIHVNVHDINAHFRQQGKAIGMATIYRHLERMLKEGLVGKYSFEGSASACYEYIGGEEQCGRQQCFHCKCTKCGTLIHLKCGELSEIHVHMLDRHGFDVDSYRTVFYGLCAECRDAKLSMQN